MRYAVKWASKKRRTDTVSGASMSAAAPHAACHVGRVASLASSARQPTRNAGHAASMPSSDQPGSVAKSVGVYVARAGAVGATGAGRGGATGGATGGVWQAARHKAAPMHSARIGTKGIGWLLVESFLAGAILIGIVWWTMRPA